MLFRHGIDPTGTGRDVDPGEFDAAWTDLVELMKIGVRRGRIIVVRPEHDHGAPAYGPRRPRTYVYRRAESRAGCAARPCSPPRWKGETCSGAPACQAG